jgi:sterol desaturase/sphingolipid hydroxylase (fatty acid hydroxylase superfamily)
MHPLATPEAPAKRDDAASAKAAYGQWRHALFLAFLACGVLALVRSAWFAAAWARWVERAYPATVMLGGSLAITAIITWSTIGVFLLLDAGRGPAWLRRFKIGTTSASRQSPPRGVVVRVALLNHVLANGLMYALFYAGLRARGWTVDPAVPSTATLLAQLLPWGALSVLAFHLTHRQLHRPWLMRRIHHVHHAVRTPDALTSQYFHFAEYVAILAPMALLGIAFAPHVLSIYLFALFGNLSAVVDHCGWSIPWVAEGGLHYAHHVSPEHGWEGRP